MEGAKWLDEVSVRVHERFAEAESSRPESDTLTLAHGLRCVVLYANGAEALLSPSISLGATIASRLQDRVQHLQIQQYGINDATVEVAADAVVEHLRG
jgi:hypothetical protein